MTGPRLTGRIAEDRIGVLRLPPLPADCIAGFGGLDDLTSTVSDALDQLGIAGAIPATVLPPSLPDARIVGRALTLENQLRAGGAAAVVDRARRGENRLADIEAHNLAEPGDVLVVKGVLGISSMGRVSARIGKRQGELGAVVDGSVRDLGASRAAGFPVWARGESPITGKYRLETVAINRPVEIGGVTVHPGDLVLADRAGVVFVPRAVAAEVLAIVQRGLASERRRLAAIDDGTPIPDLPGSER